MYSSNITVPIFPVVFYFHNMETNALVTRSRSLLVPVPTLVFLEEENCYSHLILRHFEAVLEQWETKESLVDPFL